MSRVCAAALLLFATATAARPSPVNLAEMLREAMDQFPGETAAGLQSQLAASRERHVPNSDEGQHRRYVRRKDAEKREGSALLVVGADAEAIGGPAGGGLDEAVAPGAKDSKGSDFVTETSVGAGEASSGKKKKEDTDLVAETMVGAGGGSREASGAEAGDGPGKKKDEGGAIVGESKHSGDGAGKKKQDLVKEEFLSPEEVQDILQHEFETALDIGSQMKAWSRWSIAAAILLCALWSFYPLFISAWEVPRSLFNELHPEDISMLGQYSVMSEDGRRLPEREEIRERRRVLMAEVLLNACQPFLVASLWALVAVRFGFEMAVNPPVWAQLVMIVPPVLRAVRVESWLAHKSFWSLIGEDFSKFRFPPAPFLRTKGEVIDATTDGMALVSVYMLEHHSAYFQDRLTVMWAGDPLGWLFAPLSSFLGLSGMLAIVFVIGGVTQVSAVRITIEHDGWLAADTAGMGGLAEQIREAPDQTDVYFKHLGRSVYEQIPQLLIQTMAIVAGGQGVLGNPVLLVSMCFGICLLIWRSTVLVAIGFRGQGGVAVLWGLVVMCAVAFAILRVSMSESCDSLMFAMTQWRCIPWAPLVSHRWYST